jgi:uncharacterized protein (TIGR00369 family)
MDLIPELRKRIEGLFGELLGIEFLEATPERIKAVVAVRDELCTLPGIMHGGAIMAFADTLGGAATMLNLPDGKGTTTLESKTNFFAPATTGGRLVAECVPLHRGRSTMVWQTRLAMESGKLVAIVTQTQMVLERRET